MATSLGSLNVSPRLIDLPYLPAICYEWASLLPLVIHLASYQDDYHTAGEISLLKRLPVSLFPALGTFSSTARLLEKGSEYLDCASTKGLSSRKVWDIQWGSSFPVANGAASASIISYLMKKKKPCPTKLYTLVNPHAQPTVEKVAGGADVFSTEFSSSSSAHPASFPAENANKAAKEGNNGARSRSQVSSFAPLPSPSDTNILTDNVKCQQAYPLQVLNVYVFKRIAEQQHKRSHLRRVPNQLRRSRIFQHLLTFGLILLTIFFGVLGTFGTAAITLLCALSEIVSQFITIQRPLNYLKNNEEHDACMLVAAHANAIEWDLFTGDRGIVDTLLNKPMIALPERESVRWAARWFRLANIIQLAAMTFVTAQKGWDGVCLVLLLLFHYAISWLFSSNALVGDWLDREHVDIIIKTFEFSGRMRMIGAIQAFSGTSADCWMDEILVPHLRRNLWLEKLKLPKGQALKYPDGFSEHDKKRIEEDAAVAQGAADILRNSISTSSIQSNHPTMGTP